MKTYQEEQVEKTQKLQKIAISVLPHLTGAWRMTNRVDGDGEIFGTGLIGPDEQEIIFAIPWNKPDRFEISGNFPNGLSQHLSYHGEREKTSITVAQSKDPQRIASDIENRLLPGYLRELEKCRQRKQKNDEYKDNQKNTLERIHAAVGQEGNIRDHSPDTMYCHDFHSLTVKYHSGATVRVEMTLPIETFLKVVEFIK